MEDQSGRLIILTPEEMAEAMLIGTLRQAVNLLLGYPDRTDRTGRRPGWWGSLQVNVAGAIAEKAVARYHQAPWVPLRPPGHYKDTPDVAGLEVRHTKYATGHLVLAEGVDPPDRLYALVTGTPPEVRYHGWIGGTEARRDEWLDPATRAPRRKWWVPQDALYGPPG